MQRKVGEEIKGNGYCSYITLYKVSEQNILHSYVLTTD